MQKLIAVLRLLRPANIITACADILAGFGVAGLPINSLNSLFLLLLTTMCLYGGGVMLNDVCDAELDKKERPERPIPRGIVSKKEASFIAFGLIILAILFASFVSLTSGILALSIAVLSIIYDAYTKHSLWLGPLNMGLCRGFNLLLGMSIVESALQNNWLLMVIPLIFIAAVTFVSKEEVYGGKKQLLLLSLVLYIITIVAVLLLPTMTDFHFLSALPFLIVFALLILYSLSKAIQTPQPEKIKKAVKMGIIGLILLDAAIAAGYEIG